MDCGCGGTNCPGSFRRPLVLRRLWLPATLDQAFQDLATNVWKSAALVALIVALWCLAISWSIDIVDN
jgi:hypothetical protein